MGILRITGDFVWVWRSGRGLFKGETEIRGKSWKCIGGAREGCSVCLQADYREGFAEEKH